MASVFFVRSAPYNDRTTETERKVFIDRYCTVPVNKKFTFDDRRTIVLRCERLRFVPDEMVRERNKAKNGTERKRCVKWLINYARKLSNTLNREIG